MNVGLILAYTGRTCYQRTYWAEHQMPHWVLDLIVDGHQRQRIESGEAFSRRRGVLALYAPMTRFVEYQVSGQVLQERYMVFSASGEVDAALRRLTGSDGYCHIEDPHGLIAAPLHRLGQRYRKGGPGSKLMITGLILETLGLLAESLHQGRCLRRMVSQSDPSLGLVDRVADYLDAHLDAPVRVMHLAEAVGMSESAFAHAYRRAARETPYTAIMRSKIDAAKHLLLQEGLNVQEAASRLGFSTAFNFSRTFKRVEGCAPRHYVVRHSRPRPSGRTMR